MSGGMNVERTAEMSKYLEIAGRRVGPGEPVFIIAEIGINHNGDPDLARQMIVAAAKAGADAVKFQTYQTENLVAIGNPYYEIFKQAELSSEDELKALQSYAADHGVLFFSSASTQGGLDVLEKLSLPLIKMSSANLTNIPLLQQLGRNKLPVIISSGAATLSEVIRAAEILAEFGADGVAILKCTSIYPCPPEHVNLKGMQTLQGAFEGPVGFSDHSHGPVAAIAAVALGACIVEKHFTLDKTMEGHDHHYSADPAELTEMVQGIRDVEAMQGSGRIAPVGEEVEFRAFARRYVTAMVDIPKGQRIEASMVYPKRPKDGAGVLSEYIDVVIGRTARGDIETGNSVKWDDI
jgi:N,N'-diacetyllegionaminate synthase